jgi:hypothetical protein
MPVVNAEDNNVLQAQQYDEEANIQPNEVQQQQMPNEVQEMQRGRQRERGVRLQRRRNQNDVPGVRPRRRLQQQAPQEQEFIGRQFPPQVDTYRVGAMDVVCQFCGAHRFPREELNCCHNGKVLLPPLPEYPPEFEQLLTSNDEQSRNFRENIRQYNSSVSFASFGAKTATPPGRGPYTFRLHGQIYHRAGCLHPADNAAPSYSQLYIIEENQAIQTRLQQAPNQHCREDVMTILTTVLNRVNPYAAR